MAISTTNEKLAVIEWDNFSEPGLPLSPGAFGQDDKQQLLWGFPGVLWAAAVGVDNSKLAWMEWCSIFEPGIPTNPGTFNQANKQHLIWGHPDVLWGAPPEVVASKTSKLFISLNVGRMMR